MFFANYRKTYNKTETCVYSCQYHVVFCTKYPKSVLSLEISKRLIEIINQIAEKTDAKILSLTIESNGIHMIIDCNPEIGIINCVKKIKHSSAAMLKEEFPHIKTQIPSIWTRKTFISTAGDVESEPINEYIESQKRR